MKKITILALDKSIASSVMGTMDIFCQAGLTWNKITGKEPELLFEVEIVTQDGKPVTCLNNVKIHPHRSISKVKSTDVIIISSFYDFETLTISKKCINWLKARHDSGTTIASICVGSFLLAEAGLLDDKIATTHWGFAGEFKKRYPHIQLKPERVITDTGTLLCSGACSSYIDLSMYLIERYCGRQVAVECSKTMLHDFGRSSQAPYTVFQFQKDHNDSRIITTQKWIEKNYANNCNINSIAKKSGMSLRAFERRFKTATGDTPLVYLQRVRVEIAKRFLETNNKTFNEITYEVGYEDTSFFRKVFKKHTGLLPKEYKRKFQPSL